MAAFETQLILVTNPVEGQAGPWRSPRNLLVEQAYDAHSSIHDDATARSLGFKAATIEGPTHFSQLAPMGAALWGDAFLGLGAISARYRTPAFEGDSLRAVVAQPDDSGRRARAWLFRDDGAEILAGTLTMGPDHPLTALEERLQNLPPIGARVILSEIEIGHRTRRRPVRMTFDQHMGRLYPFTLNEKLKVITEPSPYYAPEAAAGSPWGRAILPFEMISVLSQYLAEDDDLPVRRPAVGLFLDQEIRLIAGPLFVDETYEIEREVIALSGSPRTESLWTRTRIFAKGGSSALAEIILNQGYLRESFQGDAAS